MTDRLAYIGIHSSELGLRMLLGLKIQLPLSIECAIRPSNCYLMFCCSLLDGPAWWSKHERARGHQLEEIEHVLELLVSLPLVIRDPKRKVTLAVIRMLRYVKSGQISLHNRVSTQPH